ncbi:flagellar biosynthesis protein FlhB [Paracoccus litorisediminis]|uniref:EscU/YscU/HrcU family type III secretion system export apparatus switch protein n=1 Tax=Paracoccus litorisediminis TaxID=2006130 RepID=UPI003734532A
MAGDSEDKSSKTQQATEQKLRKAREKGDVPISKEVGHFFTYFALLILAAAYLPAQVNTLVEGLQAVFETAAGISAGDGQSGIVDMLAAGREIWMSSIGFLIGALGIFILAAIASGALQGPIVFSKDRITPKFNKISPMKGLTRIISGQNLWEFGKNCVKLVILIAIGGWLIWDFIDGMLPGGVMNPEDIPAAITIEIRQLLIWICAVTVPVMIADYTWKRLSHAKKQMMTMKEVKDEHKESEGDPLVKGKREQVRRKLARQRIRKSVPTATLILTNPTHYAVALRYEQGTDMAPVCVAKGADLLAHRIRAIAHEHEIPVIENRSLARALFATVEVDAVIPEGHWAQVAELVAFVFDLKKKIRRQPPKGSSLRED